MLIVVDASSPAPLYQQIHDQVVAGIATGELAPGTSLPSVRSLASDLGINLHTVNKAYAVLRDEGYVRMRGRAGAVIAHPNDADRADRNRRALVQTEDELFKLALAYRAQGGSRGQFLECAAAQAARAWGVMPEAAEDDAQASALQAGRSPMAAQAASAATAAFAESAVAAANTAISPAGTADLAQKGAC